MLCVDDALLDRWLDGALPPSEAGALATHVAGCATCSARREVRLAEEHDWRAALALDATEQAYLARADLAAAWRVAAAPARPSRWWPALVVLGLVGACLTWLLALPSLEL